MEYRRLGRTGLKVSELCLGTMQFGWTADAPTSKAVMDAFAEAGGNFIDTADIYSNWVPGNPGGVSEEIIGEWIQERKNRRHMIIATKARGRMWDGPTGEGLNRTHLIQSVDDSLRRLRTDYIDLYQTHWYDAETSIAETLETLNDLIRAGKIRYIGCSNIPAWRLALSFGVSERLGIARYDSLQPHYNLVNRAEFERELEPLCDDQGLGVMPYSPLASGFLTGKYRKDVATPASARAEGIQRRYFNDRCWHLLNVLEGVAAEHDRSPAQVALAWLLANPVVTAPIVGANSPDQLEGSLGATTIKLSTEQINRLDDASTWE